MASVSGSPLGILRDSAKARKTLIAARRSSAGVKVDMVALPCSIGAPSWYVFALDDALANDAANHNGDSRRHTDPPRQPGGSARPQGRSSGEAPGQRQQQRPPGGGHPPDALIARLGDIPTAPSPSGKRQMNESRILLGHFDDCLRFRFRTSEGANNPSPNGQIHH